MGALQLRQQQINLDQNQAINKAYTDALTVDPVSGKASVDTNGLTKALAMGGHGIAIPGILKGITQSQKAISDLAESRLKVKNLEEDAAGAVGAATLAGDGDPRLFMTQMAHAVQSGAMSQEQAAPLIQHVQGLLAQDAQDPTGASQTARDFTAQTSRQLVAGSEKYSTIANAAKAAQARADLAATAQANSERQADTAEIQNQERGRTLQTQMRADAFTQARSIALSGDPQKYKQFVDSQPAAIQGELYMVAPPAKFDAQKTPAALDNALLTPEQRAADRRAQTTADQTKANEKILRDQGADRIDLERERMNRESPAQLGAKQKLLNQAINQHSDVQNKEQDFWALKGEIGKALAVPDGQTFIDPTAKTSVERTMDGSWRTRLTAYMAKAETDALGQQTKAKKIREQYGLGEFAPVAPAAGAKEQPTPATGKMAPPNTTLDKYDTKLTAAEESQFQAWKAKNAPNDSGADYDLRGAFKAGVTPAASNGHWPDTFKKPNHPTFSNQSNYATPDAPHWEGQKLVDKSGKVVADETPKGAATAAKKAAPPSDVVAKVPEGRRFQGADGTIWKKVNGKAVPE